LSNQSVHVCSNGCFAVKSGAGSAIVKARGSNGDRARLFEWQ
jgi:hypothetical protein